MPGLGNPEAALAAGRPMAPAAQPTAPQADPMAGVLEDASPEEQELYDTYVALTLLALYDEQLAKPVAEMMRRANDHVSVVAEIAAAAAMRTYQQAREEGVDIPGEILMHGGQEITDAVIEIAEASGAEPFTPDMAEQAFLQAADTFAEGAEELGVYGQEVMAQDMQAINEMKASGRFDAIMAQLSSARDAPPDQPAAPGAPAAPAMPAQMGAV